MPLRGYRIYRDGKPGAPGPGPLGDARQPRAGDHLQADRRRRRQARLPRRDWRARSSVTTAMPPPTDGRAHAFLLASTDASFRDLQRHYQQVGTVYPTYYECRSGDGAILGVDDPARHGLGEDAQDQGAAALRLPAPEHAEPDPERHATRAAVIEGLAGLVQTLRLQRDQHRLRGRLCDRPRRADRVHPRAQRAPASDRRAQITIEVSPKNRPTTTGRSGLLRLPGAGRRGGPRASS